jgi:hypothetical protein
LENEGLAQKAGIEEVKSPDGIMAGSMLTIDVENGRDFVYNNGQSKVRITYNGNTKETNEAADILNPVWR